MDIQRWVMGDIFVNTFVVWSGDQAGVIDPGGPMEEVLQFLMQRNLKLQWIVNTHGHADHIVGNAELHEKTGAPILIHPLDRLMLTSAVANLSAFIGPEFVSPDAAMTIKDGDQLALNKESLTVIETPGHTPGGIALYLPGLLFSGDALFRESIGRTDLPGGNFDQLIHGIKQRLLILPPETLVWPGHEEKTTIQHELQHNPYFN